MLGLHCIQAPDLHWQHGHRNKNPSLCCIALQWRQATMRTHDFTIAMSYNPAPIHRFLCSIDQQYSQHTLRVWSVSTNCLSLTCSPCSMQVWILTSSQDQLVAKQYKNNTNLLDIIFRNQEANRVSLKSLSFCAVCYKRNPKAASILCLLVCQNCNHLALSLESLYGQAATSGPQI